MIFLYAGCLQIGNYIITVVKSNHFENTRFETFYFAALNKTDGNWEKKSSILIQKYCLPSYT